MTTTTPGQKNPREAFLDVAAKALEETAAAQANLDKRTAQIPAILYVDANGSTWRDGLDGALSMARTNPDNSPIALPLTEYKPVGLLGHAYIATDVDLPDSLREEAARAAERVVEFDNGDFLRIVDAIAPLLAAHFIEVGARAGIEEFDRYFRDEDENLTTAEYRHDRDAPDGARWVRHTEAEFESFAKGAAAEVLSGLKAGRL